VAAGLGVATFSDGMAAMCGPNVKLIPQDPPRTATVLMGWHDTTNNPLVDHGGTNFAIAIRSTGKRFHVAEAITPP
jgi:hypothetical protein